MNANELFALALWLLPLGDLLPLAATRRCAFSICPALVAALVASSASSAPATAKPFQPRLRPASGPTPPLPPSLPPMRAWGPTSSKCAAARQCAKCRASWTLLRCFSAARHPDPRVKESATVRRSASNFLASMRRASAIANLLIFSAKMRSSWPLVRKHCDLGPVILPLELRPALTPLPVAYPLELGPALHLGSPVQGAPGGNGPSLEVGEETR